MIKKYNISKAEKYIDKQGIEKTYWNTVGTLTEFEKQDGSISRLVEIPAISLKASVFEQKERTTTPTPKNTPIVQKLSQNDVDLEGSSSEGISVSDIPF